MQKSLCSPLNNFCNNKVPNSSSKIFSFPNNMDTPNSFSNVNERYELNESKKKQYRFQLNSLFKQLGDLQPSQIQQSFSNSLREKAFHVGISSYLGSRNYQSDLLFPGGYEHNTYVTAQRKLNKDILNNEFKITRSSQTTTP